MKRIGFTFIAAVALTAGTMSAPALAQKQEVKGIVVTNTDGTLTIKTPAGDQTIRLGDDVRIRSISGPLGGNKEVMPVTSLIPGLPVKIEVDNTSGQMVATEVDYKASDYKTAAQIEAGVQETTRRSEENQRRSMENARKEAELRAAYKQAGEWEVKAETVVYFRTNSAVISAEGKRELTSLAKQAKTHRGYVISVLGYADPSGDAAANERLSTRRAQAVINYLKQSGEVQPGRVMAASAMGEVQLKEAADTPQSYASARRVIVRVVTSKALLQETQ